MKDLLSKYRQEIVPALAKNYKNVMQVPKLDKIVLNVGAGKGIGNTTYIPSVVNDLTLITGQKPVVTKAKFSESNFKTRKGAPIGVKVTLRKAKMYDFLERLISFALPRVRDFEGLNFKSFDGKGNYTFGLKEHLIFHEIDFDKVDNIFGMDVTLVTSAESDKEAEELLRAFGLPLKDRKVEQNG